MPKDSARADVLTGADAGLIARRKAKYSNYDWVVWRDPDGVLCAGRCSAEVIKRAMLATGTQGRFTRYEARTGCAMSSSSWGVAVAWFKNARAGWL